MKKKFASLLLLLLLMCPICLRSQASFDYRDYSSSISFESWFLDAYAREREVFHGKLNSSGWWINGWNYTSELYVKTGDRWMLAEYTMSTVLAYEITWQFNLSD